MALKIVAISDTHEKHEELIIPECDILIHSGDCTNKGSLMVLYEFCEWFEKQPAKHKILIFGNHELGFSHGPKRQEALNIVKQAGLIYLENSEITIENYKIYGSPITPFFYGWEWNVHRGPEIAKIWSKIPNDIDILITHGPPYEILDLIEDDFSGRDLHQGCQDLMNKINDLANLKFHVFGHLHFQGGNQIILNNKTFINAAICDDRHRPIHLPQIIEI